MEMEIRKGKLMEEVSVGLKVFTVNQSNLREYLG